jgi:hypothetical protein
MKRFLTYIVTLLSFAPTAVLADANSDIVTSGACQANPNAVGCAGGFHILGNGGIVTNIINVVIFAVGMVSVIMIIIGGLRYTLSGGDSAGIRSAKDTIIYAIVGLAVAILAYIIVQFIIGRVG